MTALQLEASAPAVIVGLLLVVTSARASPCMPTSTPSGQYTIQSLSGGLGNIWDEGVTSGNRIRVSVRCESDFTPQSPATTTCVNGSWSRPWPTCLRPRQPCAVPTYGIRNGLQFVNGSETMNIVEYPHATVADGTWLVTRCSDPGKFRLVGNPTRYCYNGHWTGVNPTCEAVGTRVLFYGVPRQVAVNGSVVVYPHPKPMGRPRALKIECNTLSTVSATPQIQALHTDVTPVYVTRGRWPWARRVHRILLNPPQPSHSGIFTCTAGSLSHSVEVLFSEMECPAPDIQNGETHDISGWEPGRYPITKQVRFSCSESYRLVGAETSTCMLGEWSSPTPVCEASRCPEPTVPAHAQMFGVYGTGRNIGDERIFHCVPGYVMQEDYNLVECLEGGVWSKELPTCEAVVVVERPIPLCDTVHCESWQKCVITSTYSTRCGCISPFNCATAGPIVCGTDGTNYTSVCHLKATACLLETGVNVSESNDICINGLPPIQETPDERDEQDLVFDYSSSSFSDVERFGHPNRDPPVVSVQTQSASTSTDSPTRDSPSPPIDAPDAARDSIDAVTDDVDVVTDDVDVVTDDVDAVTDDELI